MIPNSKSSHCLNILVSYISTSIYYHILIPHFWMHLFFTVCILCVFTLILISHINWTVFRNEITIRCCLVNFVVLYVICVFVCVHWFSLYFFVCHCVHVCLCIICYFSSNVNCVVYNTLMYVHIFGYLVNILERRWLYLSPIEKCFCIVSMTITLEICITHNTICIMHCMIHCINSYDIYFKSVRCSIFCLIYYRIVVKIELNQCQRVSLI